MISIIQFGRLYRYKRTYRNVYIVHLDNGKIIRIQDIYFHKGNIFNRRDKEKAFLKAVFDKDVDKKLTFRKIRFRIIFGSNIEVPTFRTSKTLQPTSINQKPPTAKKLPRIQSNLFSLLPNREQSNFLSFPPNRDPTFTYDLYRSDIVKKRDIETDNIISLSREEEIRNILKKQIEEALLKTDNIAKI